jgi:DNA-binding NarL/FixJ family response regulator
MIRIVLVDDHLLLRQGTATLLQAADDIKIVGETGQGEEALELARQLNPDVVVLDIRLLGMSGIEVARTLRQDLPGIKVVMLSAYHHEQYVRALFAIGVHGYLLKNASGPELTAAVHAVCRGETVLSNEVSAQIAANQTRRSGIAANETLSERERQVLALVRQGISNKEIATQLGLGVRTIETHVSNAMAKLGARSRLEAINLAVQRGFISLE